MEYHMGSAEKPHFDGERNIREQPPRYINIFTKLTVLFGGLLQQMGWGMFGFGMIFFWVFVMNSEARYLLAFDGKWTDTQGTLVSVGGTNSSVNDQPIYAYKFKYMAGYEEREAISYDYFHPEMQAGNFVRVQYKSGNAKRARIEGMSSSTFPTVVVVVVIFPLIGFFMILGGFYKNLKALRLLVHGQFTKGKIVGKGITGSRVNNNPVYKYTFEFEVGNEKHYINCSTYQTWKVEDEAMEIILYDKDNPTNGIVFDAIAGVPQIMPNGQFDATPLSSASLLILPIVAIGLNVLAYYIYSILTSL